jgi:hypothetical protein
MDNRAFYHSFPRRGGMSESQTIDKGLQILRFIFEVGLVLAPEFVTWRHSTEGGPEYISTTRQRRMCFTELSRAELGVHGRTFGSFSIEYPIDALRGAGALPVMYIAQKIGAEPGLSEVGAVIVNMLGHAKYAIDLLHLLSMQSDIDAMRKTYGQVREDYTINLRNVDDGGAQVQAIEVPAKTIQDILKFIGFRNAPFDKMSGTLSAMQSLFYPTDDTYHSKELAYYRQREWRLLSGLRTGGADNSRPLSTDEAQRLVDIDPEFWTRTISDKDGSVRRIDDTHIVEFIRGKKAREMLSAVIVPPAAVDRATEIVGDSIPLIAAESFGVST